MSKLQSIPFSILDLTPIVEGSQVPEAFGHSLDLAQHAERLGYRRFWLAEHHNFSGIASAATAVAIGYIAGGTRSIRVGAGGVMLPNHAPLVIAEQFGTLEALYPGRIDLGLGRAPGTDRLTTRALRRNLNEGVEAFPRDVKELQAYFQPAQPDQKVRAIPGEGMKVPIWLLGSSLFSARLAARRGLPYAFASHFAPDALTDALALYRNEFQASEQLQEPYTMAGLNVIAAESDAEGRRLFTSLQQQFLRLQQGDPGRLQPPVNSMDALWSPMQKAWVDRSLRESIIGSAETVQDGIAAFHKRTGIDEVMATVPIYDSKARIRSIEILAEQTIFASNVNQPSKA